MPTPSVPKTPHDYHVKVACPTSEVDPVFLQGMANRMAVSFFKYGPAADGYPHVISALDSLRQRLSAYCETGNTEYLIDAANFAMIEFMLPAHPGAHFRATDSDGSPGRVANGGQVTDASNDAVSGAYGRRVNGAISPDKVTGLSPIAPQDATASM